MGIKGINSILYASGDNFWHGEQPPSDDFVELANHLNARIRDDALTLSDAELVNKLAGMRLEPSQEMRKLYFQAYLLRELYDRDFRQAYALFGHALDIAEEHEDLDSQLVLADQQALMLYGLGKNYDAINHYEIALEIWQARKQTLTAPPVEPEMHLLDRISVVQLAVGEFERSAGTLARVLTVVEQQTGMPQSPELRLTTAKTLWTLGLIYRAQSDQQDGSETLLLRALMRFKQALIIFREVGEHEISFGRLWIQVVETYLDLSGYYLQHALGTRARQAREKASARLLMAQSAAKYARDSSGTLLIELALLRWQITQPPDRNAVREMNAFDQQLKIIELSAMQQGLPAIAGKAAMLRGEWLLWRGDAPHARSALFLALANLHANNMGETPRVLRLLRRSNEAARAQRVRRRATGPRIRHPRKRTDAL